MPIEPRWIPYRYRGGVNTSDVADPGSPTGIDTDANDNLWIGAAETTPGAHPGGINTMFLDGSVRTIGPQVNLSLTFQGDRIDPSGSSEIDPQGRLLVGTDGGIWSGGGDNLLIGGRTTFDFDGDGKDYLEAYHGVVTVAVGDMEASGDLLVFEGSAAGERGSVTDLIIDPFNNEAGHWQMHDLLLANQNHLDANTFVYLYYTTSTPNSDVDGGLLSTVDQKRHPCHHG